MIPSSTASFYHLLGAPTTPCPPPCLSLSPTWPPEWLRRRRESPRTNAHHQNAGGLPKSPNSEPGAPTGPAYPERAPSHIPEVGASIFLELIFRIGIHASNLPDLPSSPPRCQTAPPPCASIVLRLLPRPCCAMSPRPTTVDVVEEHRSTIEPSTGPCRCPPPRLMPPRGETT
jgi:hypothetical protein